VAHSKFNCQVLTPEGEAFNGDVEMVSTRTGVGSLGILAHHAPLMGMLEPTELRLYRSENDIVRLAQSEGYLQVADNQCLLLVEDVVEPDKLDRSDLEEKLRASEQESERCEEGSEERERHLRDARRYRAFIEIASST
jgi:F-type H+-transporting ATPase subunit epsilon